MTLVLDVFHIPRNGIFQSAAWIPLRFLRKCEILFAERIESPSARFDRILPVIKPGSCAQEAKTLPLDYSVLYNCDMTSYH